MNPASEHNDRQVVRGRPGWRVTLVAALTALVLAGLPAAAAATGPTPAAFTLTGTVTWVGGPDSRATVGVSACPIEEQGSRCPSLRRTTVAADGSYSLPLPYGRSSTWSVNAFVSVGSASRASVALGAPEEVTVPRSPHDPLPLAISTRVVGMRVIDGEGNPFPEGTASVMAIPTSPTAGWRVPGADANGDALLLADPAVEYDVNAFAINTGWPDPWVSPDGTEFHFSQNSVRALGADLVEGTTFVVARPAGVLLRVVDGDGNLFPAGMSGVHACDRGGNRVPECVGAMDNDGDGAVLLPPLDPTVRWEVYGVAVDTGWPDPLVTPDGTEYHLSPTVILEPGDVLDEGTVFVVAKPT